jgi:hypothetical protein
MYIRVNPRDNVAILVHPDGVATGALLPDGLVAREAIPRPATSSAEPSNWPP